LSSIDRQKVDATAPPSHGIIEGTIVEIEPSNDGPT
jgi:hypothetical protein